MANKKIERKRIDIKELPKCFYHHKFMDTECHECVIEESCKQGSGS